MSTKGDMPKQVGIIGQMYEDRKSKRVGVLESRDEKYKTLMFRDSKGKSFTVVYSTFRSNWRKYSGDAPVIKTSTQIEVEKAAVDDAKKAVDVVKDKVEKSPKVTREDIVEAIKRTYDYVESQIKANNVSKVVLKRTAKGAIVLKYGRKTLVEIWTLPRAEVYNACTNLTLDDVKGITHERRENWLQKELYRSKELEPLVEIVISAVMKYLLDVEEKKEENKEEEEE